MPKNKYIDYEIVEVAGKIRCNLCGNIKIDPDSGHRDIGTNIRSMCPVDGKIIGHKVISKINTMIELGISEYDNSPPRVVIVAPLPITEVDLKTLKSD